MQVQSPCGGLLRTAVKLFDEIGKGIALRAGVGIDMNVMGDSRIGTAQRQSGVEMAGLVKSEAMWRHVIPFFCARFAHHAGFAHN